MRWNGSSDEGGEVSGIVKVTCEILRGPSYYGLVSVTCAIMFGEARELAFWR